MGGLPLVSVTALSGRGARGDFAHARAHAVKLFYYMSLAPHTHSKLSIVDLLTGSAAIAPQISQKRGCQSSS
jgi:hypothetical protein